MPVVIPDDVLQQTKLTEQEVRITLACHFFETGRLQLWPAAKVAGLSRVQFEAELQKRKIPVFRPSTSDLIDDLNALKSLGS